MSWCVDSLPLPSSRCPFVFLSCLIDFCIQYRCSVAAKKYIYALYMDRRVAVAGRKMEIKSLSSRRVCVSYLLREEEGRRRVAHSLTTRLQRVSGLSPSSIETTWRKTPGKREEEREKWREEVRQRSEGREEARLAGAGGRESVRRLPWRRQCQ